MTFTPYFCSLSLIQVGKIQQMPLIKFIDKDGKTIEVEAKIGLSLLEVARKYDIDIEGACDGALACSTCHVIVEQEFFAKLPPASDAEEDMLDLAFGLAPTSRLGCQIIVTDKIDGLTVRLPSATRNIMLD